ncbi:hypothetical protein B0H17DRAFT_1202945 [Mycena rosella]|uniref:BOD1/SHG1 domain-containing protein n=1 Tax=Mycena rosella TaxID=1033263 RepID=A0AAD7GCP8_MYCRO|nr:hypothetical protein B0H17DRAFT_1202945 [Mycena rosella]
MPIADPTQLVAEFKKSGEFDKLRRELLADSQRSSGFEAFKARIDEIARERIKSGQTSYTAPDLLHKELMQEVNRFPVVERFASEVPMLSDSAFKDGIRSSIERILREDRGQKDLSSAPAPPQPSTDSASAKEEENLRFLLQFPLQFLPKIDRERLQVFH